MITDLQYLELEEWSQCEGSEWGETASLLLQLHSYSPYFSGTLLKALEKEITSFYKEGKKHIKFVEREDTRVVKEFVWDE